MKASELIGLLQRAVKEHGDLDIVSGVDRSGYGEPVTDLLIYSDKDKEPTKGIEGNVIPVFDLELGDESLVAVNGNW